MSIKNPALLSFLSVLFLWLAQPPLGFWPLAFIALTPLLLIVDRSESMNWRQYFLIGCAGFVYWLVTLQGLRHAHPAMYACWIALSAYLACYLPLFVVVARRSISHRVPLWVATPIVWVGLECIRNYMLTGISAAMLGHSMANVAILTQVADLFGSYGVSYVVAMSSAAFQMLWKVYRSESTAQDVKLPLAIVGGVFGVTIGYGIFRLNQADGPALATFALIQRDEVVDIMQDAGREVEIAKSYADQTIEECKASEEPIDAIVWPESMFTGGVPWYVAEEDAVVPAVAKMTREEFAEMIRSGQSFVKQRSFLLQSAAQLSNESERQPHLIVGSGVIRYADRPYTHSGVLHVKPTGEFSDWYAKTHLVLVGEHIPFSSLVPPLHRRVPHVDPGPGPKIFQVGETVVCPNICIETAVERVTVNQLAELRGRNEMPDVVVTVTNDGWFDDSSILEHHLRCAQLVAVATRRPILSAANNGPTAWIDSRGQVVERLKSGTNGSVVATPTRDHRTSLYLVIRDWPARILAIICIGVFVEAVFASRKSKD